jgi:hypothetical protein
MVAAQQDNQATQVFLVINTFTMLHIELTGIIQSMIACIRCCDVCSAFKYGSSPP